MGMLKIKPMQRLGKNLELENYFVFKKCCPSKAITLTIEQLIHITGLTKTSLRELNFLAIK